MLNIPHHGSSAAKFVTVSIGVVTAICVNGGAATELILKADEQLYVAKAHGRNRAEATQIRQQAPE
jgi:PleD family two-component response regulator